MSYTYVQFDTKDRTGIGVFKDKRVREAMLKAIDRPALIKAFVRLSTGTIRRSSACATSGTSAARRRLWPVL